MSMTERIGERHRLEYEEAAARIADFIAELNDAGSGYWWEELEERQCMDLPDQRYKNLGFPASIQQYVIARSSDGMALLSLPLENFLSSQTTSAACQVQDYIDVNRIDRHWKNISEANQLAMVVLERNRQVFRSRITWLLGKNVFISE